MINRLDQVLSLFSLERTELTGPEIAGFIRRPKSTVYRLLGTFTSAGYIDQDQDTGRYRLGIRLAALGDVARHSTSIQRLLAWRPEHELSRFLKPPLKRFTARTITDLKRLKAELALTRRNGLAQVWMGKAAIKAAEQLSAQLGLGGRAGGGARRQASRGPARRRPARRASPR